MVLKTYTKKVSEPAFHQEISWFWCGREELPLLAGMHSGTVAMTLRSLSQSWNWICQAGAPLLGFIPRSPSRHTKGTCSATPAAVFTTAKQPNMPVCPSEDEQINVVHKDDRMYVVMKENELMVCGKMDGSGSHVTQNKPDSTQKVSEMPYVSYCADTEKVKEQENWGERHPLKRGKRRPGINEEKYVTYTKMPRWNPLLPMLM